MRPQPRDSIIVIVNRATGHEAVKRIKGSAKTVSITTQYHARHPDYFVYRVNVYQKARAL